MDISLLWDDDFLKSFSVFILFFLVIAAPR